VSGSASTRPWNTDGGIHEITLPPGTAGRLWLCGKHVIGPDVHAVLDRTGARTVVCLTERHELHERYGAYVEWLDTADGDRAVWFPVHDMHAPDVEAGSAFVDDLVDRLARGHGMIVHCGAGIGRAGTTAAAVLIRLGVPITEALTSVRRDRPAAGPETAVQHAFLVALDERMRASG
jgi:protein-tyrosine phosphatase